MTTPQDPQDPFLKKPAPDGPGSQPGSPPPPPGGAYGQPPGQPPAYGQQPPPYGQPAGYGAPAPGPGYPAPGGQHDPNGRPGLVVASLITGILGFVGITALLAIIFGFLGRSQAKSRGQRGSTMAVVGIVLGFLWIFGLIALLAIGGFASTQSNAFDLKEGDCVEEEDRLTRIGLTDLKPVDCAELHEAEVVAVIDVTSLGDDYPGESALQDRGRSGCSAQASDVARQNSSLEQGFVYPNDTFWGTEDNRRIICTLSSSTPRSGSVFD